MDHGWVLSVTAASAPAFRWVPELLSPASGKIWMGLFSVGGGWLADFLDGLRVGPTMFVFERWIWLKDRHWHHSGKILHTPKDRENQEPIPQDRRW